MMKSYLRYAPRKTFGVIASPNCNIALDSTGQLVFTGGIQECNVWNLRQTSLISQFPVQEVYNNLYGAQTIVTFIHRSPDECTVAVGCSNGDIKIYNYITNSLVITLSGHRSAITSLAYDVSKKGMTLASGSADSDIYVWDLVSNTAISKLRGHKDAVTGLAFLKKGLNEFIVSVSKDTQMKVWDLETSYCIQTVLDHRSEIWGLVLLPSLSGNSGEEKYTYRILTISSDEYIRAYRVFDTSAFTFEDLNNKNENEANEDIVEDEENLLEYYGKIKKPIGKNAVDRYVVIKVNDRQSLLGVQTNGKAIDFFRLKSLKESYKTQSNRLKRQKKRKVKDMEEVSDLPEIGDNEDDGEGDSIKNRRDLIFSDEVEYVGMLMGSYKYKAFDFQNVRNSQETDHIIASTVNNLLEVHKVELSGSQPCVASISKTAIMDMHGHRSDVRGVCVSGDGATIASCSSEGLKIWSSSSHNCIRSCASGFGVSVVFVKGTNYVVMGTKEGAVQIIDTIAGEVVMNAEAAHAGAVWAVATRPDNLGFATGGADKVVRFWEFSSTNGDNSITAAVTKQLQMTQDILSVKYNYAKSGEKLLVAVGLLDATVKLFFEDSLKFYLTLYGHKLPVMSIDISYDSLLLVSGSADKTIKIWGLDFGDCHRSLIGHTDSVTCIKFQPLTHYFFSTGKDGLVKYWDADRFEQVLSLPGHRGPAWCLDFANDTSFFVTSGQDRTLRIWEKTDDLVFVEEEKERALEAMADRAAVEENRDKTSIGKDVNAEAAASDLSSANLKNVHGGEIIMMALDTVEAEMVGLADWEAEKAKNSKVAAHAANPIMLGAHPYTYMAKQLARIAQPDLENALIVLPFDYVIRLIRMLVILSRRGYDLEMCCRAVLHMIRVHFPRISNTGTLITEMMMLKKIIDESVDTYRHMIGVNLTGLRALLQDED